MYKICILLLWLGASLQLQAQTQRKVLNLKVVDKQNKPIFGVYVALSSKALLLATTDIDGECQIDYSSFSEKDTIQFQGMEYSSQKTTIQELIKNPIVHLKELKYELAEAQIQGISPDLLLKAASEKLKKQKVSRHPMCRYYGPAQYEKITQCRDTVVEYRREYGLYFTSGNIAPYNIWDQTFRSYIVPAYMARSYNLSLNGQDTIVPLYMTSKQIRLDIGTRKIFTLTRAIQLFAPLFNDRKYYDIHLIETGASDYIFSFKTCQDVYPEKIKITCKGTFTIDRTQQFLKKMDFDYIDYQLLRQILLSKQRKIASPFSTRASISFALNHKNQPYIQSCQQTTTWKYDLGNEFTLIEQPSRDLPGYNQLIEKEAFYCYEFQPVNQELQNAKVLSKIHLAHRYPFGTYEPEVFKNLPQLLEANKAYRDLGRYMNLEDQFQLNSDRPYYPENYLLDSDIDLKERINYLKNLSEARTQLFQLFKCPVYTLESHTHPHPNK